MHITILVNSVKGLEPKQTTSLITHYAATQGHKLYVMGISDLSCDDHGEIWGQVVPITNWDSQQAMITSLRETNAQPMRLRDNDVVLIRTNPGRDYEHSLRHSTGLLLLEMLSKTGVLVLNDPAGLMRAASKLYLQKFPPAIRPRTLTSYNEDEIIAFIQQLSGPAVLKPLRGTRGNDVFMVQSAEDKNLRQIINVLVRQDMAVVQSFIPEAVDGDIRVMVLDGEMMEIDNHIAAFRRQPGEGDFRSNLHAGGSAGEAIVTPAMREVVRQSKHHLQEDGIFLAGLDFIGDKIVEINVFSPGGFGMVRKLTQVNFAEMFFEKINQRLAAR